MNQLTRVVFPCLAPLGLFLGLLTTPGLADDWPQWGGPKRDLVWREKGIVKTLPTKGLLPRVWSTPIGEGYSGPAVADGRVYITDFIREKRIERILRAEKTMSSTLAVNQNSLVVSKVI